MFGDGACDEAAGRKEPTRRGSVVKEGLRQEDGRRGRHPDEASSSGDSLVDRVVSEAEEQKHAYAHGAGRPLGAYAGIASVYFLLVAGLAWLARRRGAKPPVRLSPGDLALATVATAKLSRIIAKDPITSPLRAPFTRYQGRSGEAELAEEVRGTGARHALGELLTCPFCIGQWVATAFGAGFVLAPEPTRLAAAVGTAVAGGDVLQYGFGALEQGWKRLSG